MEIKEYKKKKNAYNPLEYKANKKITADEWNALWLSTMYQGNYQDEALGYIINEVLIDHNDELKKKIGRIDATNIPEGITYSVDGAKSLNNLYYNFTHSVEDKGSDVNGALLVLKSGPNQVEFFFTEDGELYSRKGYSGVFKNASKQAIMKLAYTKDESDERFVHSEGDENIEGTKTFQDSPNVPAPTLDEHPVNKLYLEENYSDKTETADLYYNKGESETIFVNSEGNETVSGIKDFVDGVKVPYPATSNNFAINRGELYSYTYSKEDIENLTTPIGFETEQNLLDWLDGTFSRPDGVLPNDLIIGKKVIIKERGKNNYQVASKPVIDINDFKVLVEDHKFAGEIGFVSYGTITANNTQNAVEQVKDETDLKSQITEQTDLTIEVADWVEQDEIVYYDYENENYTNATNQRFEFISNDAAQNSQIIEEGISFLSVETVPGFKVRITLNKKPTFDITFKVMLSTYTDSNYEAGEIQAHLIAYNNIISGLDANEVQGAIDELSDTKINKTSIKQVTGSGLFNLMSQNAITDSINTLNNLKIDKTNIVQTTGSSTTDIMSQKAISDELGLKATIADVNNELDLKIDKSSIKQVTGSSTDDLMSQKAISDELDLKADKLDFQGTAGDIFYVNAIGELAKLPKSNNSFLGVSNAGEVKWVKTTNLTSSPYGVYQTEVSESGDVEPTSQFYKDGFRKYYIINPASGQPPFPLGMQSLVTVGFTNVPNDEPLFGSVVLNTAVTGYSHATAYGISTVMDLTNVPNKYLIMRDHMSLVVMSTEETNIESYLARAYVVSYNATSSL